MTAKQAYQNSKNKKASRHTPDKQKQDMEHSNGSPLTNKLMIPKWTKD